MPEQDLQQVQPDQGASNIYMEVGRSGLRRFGGYVYEEFLRDLQGPRAAQVYKEMSMNDPVIGAMLFAVDKLIRQTEWRVEPAGENPDDQEAAQFVEECMNDMSQSWTDTISEILSFIPYGWAYHELVYKKREGPEQRDPRRRSKYRDGKIGWRKIPGRAQESLLEWVFDEEGGIQGLIQLAAPDYQRRFIPIEKALLFRTTMAKNNPEGLSALRNSVRPWMFKKTIEEVEGIGIERDLAGLPVIYAPAQIFAPDASPKEKALLETLKRIVTQIRRDESEGLLMPQGYDQNGNTLYKLELLSTGSRRQFDTNAVITRYDQRIAMTVLADFILLGHANVGSFALSSDKTALFAVALGAWLDVIAGVFNRHAIPRLFELNGWALENYPTIVHGDIEVPDLAALGEYISKLAGAGATLFPDDELENALRAAAKLPMKPIEEDPGAAAMAAAQEGAAGGFSDPLLPDPFVDPLTGEGDPGDDQDDETLGKRFRKFLAGIGVGRAGGKK